MSRDDFERLDRRAALGTSKLLSRDDVRLELGDDLAGDFIGRLVTLFGAPDPGGEFVLRHRPSTLVLTAYSAQSGPSYGGQQSSSAPPPDEALDREKTALEIQLFDRRKPKQERKRLHDQRRALARKLLDPCAPGFYAVAEALETLIAGAQLADYEVIDDSGDFGPRRVGVRGGEAFDEPMSFDETMAYYIDRIESAPNAGGLYAVKLFFQLDRGSPAVRKRWVGPARETWMKLLASVERNPDEEALRKLLADFAGRLAIPQEAQARLAVIKSPP